MMKVTILALLSLTAGPVFCQEDSISQDYLVQLLYNISEPKIPSYVVKTIYTRGAEKNITSQDVLELFQINNISFASTENILHLLNIPRVQVFSINGFNYTLELFNWTFVNFYNTLVPRLNIAGTPLRNALMALNIDAIQFSAGITWGDPDPWLEFIKGNFTQENVERACSEAGITLENLWAGVRDLFIGNVVTYDIQSFVQLLLDHSVNRERALVIWNGVPITVAHVYSLQLYNDILSEFITRVSNETSLGVVTSTENVVIPRVVHDIFREERELLDIRAETLLTKTVLNISTIDDTIYRNLVALRYTLLDAINVTIINVTNVNSNIFNCSYVTFNNNSILSVNVPQAIFLNETYQLPRNVTQIVISGSPLVCNDTVFALTRGVVGDDIIADAFSDFVTPPSSSSGNLIRDNLFVTILLLILKRLQIVNCLNTSA